MFAEYEKIKFLWYPIQILWKYNMLLLFGFKSKMKRSKIDSTSLIYLLLVIKTMLFQ